MVKLVKLIQSAINGSKGHLIAMMLLLIFIIPLSSAVYMNNFTIVVMPDTQSYTTGEQPMQSFINQIDWILNNSASSNIRAVLHVGDLVETTTHDDEWVFAMGQMNRLKGKVPFIITAGNHDIQSHNYDMFPRYVERPFVDYFIDEDINMGFISLIDCPDYQSNEGWLSQANSIVKAHNETPFVLVTHNYLWTIGYSICQPLIWENLVKNNSNIFMVQSGHWTGEAETYQYRNSTNYVYEMLIDHQDDGNGFMRILNFIPEQNLIMGTTFASQDNLSLNFTTEQFNFTYKMNPYLYPNYTYWNETIENNSPVEKNETIISLIYVINETTGLNESYNVSETVYWNETIYSNYTIEHMNTSYDDYLLPANLTSYQSFNVYGYTAPQAISQNGNSGSGGGGSSSGSGGSIIKKVDLIKNETLSKLAIAQYEKENLDLLWKQYESEGIMDNKRGLCLWK